MDATVFVLITSLILLVYLVYRRKKSNLQWNAPVIPFPQEHKAILLKHVLYYTNLNSEKKKRFEFKIQEFLENCRVTGVDTDVFDLERILVASSAIIPIFNFPDWQYTNIDEVLVYPTSFNERYETAGEWNNILGMVGNGPMEGKMILSKQALHNGFDNESDKKNTAIHEFVHLIDKTDGTIDGIPSLLLEQPYTLPWLDLVHKKISDIYQNKSDINPYGATNKVEFFAVVSEYFFERPKQLNHKHPELYKNLELIFKQNLAESHKNKSSIEINRNDPCPCGSGKKYKKCCGKVLNI
jgi:Mlc titration factor MtfA (ptsG expression regulator)